MRRQSTRRSGGERSSLRCFEIQGMAGGTPSTEGSGEEVDHPGRAGSGWRLEEEVSQQAALSIRRPPKRRTQTRTGGRVRRRQTNRESMFRCRTEPSPLAEFSKDGVYYKKSSWLLPVRRVGWRPIHSDGTLRRVGCTPENSNRSCPWLSSFSKTQLREIEKACIPVSPRPRTAFAQHNSPCLCEKRTKMVKFLLSPLLARVFNVVLRAPEI